MLPVQSGENEPEMPSQGLAELSTVSHGSTHGIRNEMKQASSETEKKISHEEITTSFLKWRSYYL
jgi:hypothetical protein